MAEGDGQLEGWEMPEASGVPAPERSGRPAQHSGGAEPSRAITSAHTVSDTITNPHIACSREAHSSYKVCFLDTFSFFVATKAKSTQMSQIALTDDKGSCPWCLRSSSCTLVVPNSLVVTMSVKPF